MIDYSVRLQQARSRMAERNIGLMFLPPGANLFYLTGIRRPKADNTDTNAYGDWAVGAFVGLQEGIVLAAPRMGGGYYVDEAQGKPWFKAVRIIKEEESPLDVLREVVGQFNLGNQQVAVAERTWAQTTLALQSILPDNHVVSASSVIDPLRMIKEEGALDLMRKAGQITGAAFEAALAQIQLGMTEYELAQEIDYQYHELGAEYTSFETGIRFNGPDNPVGAGAQRATERKLMPGDSITFDFGCVYKGYCSDFGRSAFVGEPPADYLRVHDIVLRAQAEAMKAMKAGQITAREANAIARGVIQAEGYDEGFTHRLGHGIGITVHEPPFLDQVNDTVLQANMTFTVEPSIRLPGWYSNRVEDVVVVTATGAVSLYTTPRHLYIIE